MGFDNLQILKIVKYTCIESAVCDIIIEKCVEIFHFVVYNPIVRM